MKSSTITIATTSLYFREGSSDKEYHASIEPKDDGYIVTFAYGRRGNTLSTGTKTPHIVTLEQAHAIHDKLVASKVAKGYKPDGQPAATYAQSGDEGQDSGIRCQLLNPVEGARLIELLNDSQHCLQEKHDGRRMLVRKKGEEITGINRRGLVIAIPNPIRQAVGELPMDVLIDGEAVGETLHAFDLLEMDCHDLRERGYLLDSQTDYAINVAEQFDLSGDKSWLKGQKEPCERALEWLLKRDSDGDGLVEMMTDSHKQGKSSDWIDVVWASWENAFVNARLYYALTLWTEREEILGDSVKATRYRLAAARLRESFIKPVSQGGFWNPDKGWFVYWQDKDKSIHGDNLVTAVNFAAIAYGLATPGQRQTVLDGTEARMRKENLFHWPSCFLPYAADEGASGAKFPDYENGDIFLSWGELGVRSYAGYDPATAVAYVNRVLERYRKDGLSFQRYQRAEQTGAGDDILAGNCMTIVGLYRDIYGVRPQWNRLMLTPAARRSSNTWAADAGVLSKCRSRPKKSIPPYTAKIAEGFAGQRLLIVLQGFDTLREEFLRC